MKIQTANKKVLDGPGDMVKTNITIYTHTHTRASSFCVRILQETKMKSKKSKHVDHDKTCRDR